MVDIKIITNLHLIVQTTVLSALSKNLFFLFLGNMTMQCIDGQIRKIKPIAIANTTCKIYCAVLIKE